MSFLGNRPDSFGYSSTSYDHFNGTGSQTVYTLTRSVSANADIFVTVNNVPQDPGVAYYVTDLNTLTFTSAPSAVANNIVVVYRNFVQTGLALGANTVTSFTIAPGAVQAYQISSVSNTSISGKLVSSQITSVANTQITGNIISSQITSVANTQITGLITSAQLVTSAQYMGFKNKIINGDMRIDQRNGGASVTPSADTYLVDRWSYGASQASKFTWQQNKGSITPPVGFANYLGGSVASAVSIGSTDYFRVIQPIEGLNVSDLQWGTANAKTVTLSFQVYSSLTGTFGGVLANNTFFRTYPFTYSIPTANTWTSISITIAGDTSGTWLTNNSAGINVVFGLGVGSTYSGTAGSWGVGYNSATGAVSVVGTNAATWYITGVQLEVGSSASSFEVRDYGRELAMCQRYYQTLSIRVPAPAEADYSSIATAVRPRTTPTVAGGGTGFAASPSATGLYLCSQTTAEFRDLTFSAEL